MKDKLHVSFVLPTFITEHNIARKKTKNKNLGTSNLTHVTAAAIAKYTTWAFR